MTSRDDHWFEPKRFGYGAAPANLKGWAVSAAFVLFILAAAAALVWEIVPLWAFVVAVFAATVALVVTTRVKSSGEWHWRWG